MGRTLVLVIVDQARPAWPAGRLVAAAADKLRRPLKRPLNAAIFPWLISIIAQVFDAELEDRVGLLLVQQAQGTVGCQITERKGPKRSALEAEIDTFWISVVEVGFNDVED